MSINVLARKLQQRRISAELVSWIVDVYGLWKASGRKVNDYNTRMADPPQTGLPKDSPLSPILFLHFNNDLVTSQDRSKQGSRAIFRRLQCGCCSGAQTYQRDDHEGSKAIAHGHIGTQLHRGSPIWSVKLTDRVTRMLHRVQRMGTQAIVGAFRTVALARIGASVTDKCDC